MRLLSALTSLAVLAATFAASAAPSVTPQQVEIPSNGGTLHAQLFKPDGAGPFPTVIALHGCGGLNGESDKIQPRYRDWAEQLLKDGNAVLLPDSYGSRELGPQCRVKERRVLARRERVADIMASRQWLLQQPWVSQDRISLIGWAHGASAVLWAVRPQLASRKVEPDFRSAVAFYPDCRISSGLGWSARVPTLLLIGASDDVSSPAACRQMVERCAGTQRAGADRGVSRRGSRFRPREFPLACDCGSRSQPAGTRPSRRRSRRPRRFAKARGRVAGALKQTALTDRLRNALRRGRLRLACSGFRLTLRR